jgi:RimJ/RimL family protein N-acetyltransferase
MQIRVVTVNDVQKMLDYFNKVGGETDFLTFGLGEFDASFEDEKNFIEQILQKENCLFIVAEEDEKIIGSLNFVAGQRKKIEHVGDLGLTVLKEYWNLKIGTKLLDYFVNWAKASKIVRKVNLKVRVDNKNAIHLYKKMGFVEEGLTTRDFYVDNQFYDSFLMGLTIN